MNRDDIKSQMQSIFHEVMNDSSIELRDDMTADDHEAWDSLSHINLIIAVENGFGVRIKNAEVARLENVGDLINLVEKKKSK